MQDKAQLIMASTAKDLAKRLSTAVAAVCALSEAELQEERSSEEEGEETSVLRLALLRVLAMLRTSAAPAEEAATLKSTQKLLAVRLHMHNDPSTHAEVAGGCMQQKLCKGWCSRVHTTENVHRTREEACAVFHHLVSSCRRQPRGELCPCHA